MVIVGKCQISLSKMAKIKRKNLFDHINAITSQQHSNYWDDISDEDKKSWSNYIVNRFLSMKMEWIEFVNEVQKYPLKPKELYKVYTDMLPKKRQWLKYIKGDKEMKYPKWVYEIVAKHLQISSREASDAVDMYELSHGGQAELTDILIKYGRTVEEIRKIGL